jgi:hypothetical protein
MPALCVLARRGSSLTGGVVQDWRGSRDRAEGDGRPQRHSARRIRAQGEEVGGGKGQIDAALVASGREPASISKYRLGVGLLLAEDPESAHHESLRNCFA